MARDTAPRFFVAESDPPSKQAILRAALQLFVKHGLAGTNVRMIAEEAGYTNPAMFKFFESKDALALYLFERCYLRLHGLVAAAAARPSFDDALAGVVDAFLSAMDDDLEAVLFVQDTLRELWPRLPAPVRRHSIFREVRRLVERGIRDGAITGYRSPEVPVAAVVGVVAQLGRMVYFGEVARPARARRAELVLALTRSMKG